MSSQQYTGMIHACMCVCVLGWGGGGGLWVCLASVSGPMCIFVFVIRMTARRFSLAKDKTKVLNFCTNMVKYRWAGRSA